MRRKIRNLILPALLCLAMPALAAEFKAANEITIDKPLQSDLYAAGSSVQIQASAFGDINVVAGELEIIAPVSGDVQAAAGQIKITAAVRDDVRLAGGNVKLHGPVGGDAIVGGGKITLESAVAEDVILAGGDIVVRGPVGGKARIVAEKIKYLAPLAGDLTLSADTIEINGAIRGQAILSARTITLGSGASFSGGVRYWSENNPEFPADAGAIRDEELKLEDRFDSRPDSAIPGIFAMGFFGFFYSLLSGIIVIMFLLAFFEEPLKVFGSQVQGQVFTILGKGMVFVFGSPPAILILLALVVTIPLALFWMAMYGFAFLFSAPFIALIGAFAYGNERNYTKTTIALLAIGILAALTLLGLIPVIGFIAGIFWAAGAAGCLIQFMQTKRN